MSATAPVEQAVDGISRDAAAATRRPMFDYVYAAAPAELDRTATSCNRVWRKVQHDRTQFGASCQCRAQACNG